MTYQMHIVMQFPADWCKSHMDCWAQIVDSWQRPETYVKCRKRRENRLAAMKRASHHQGSVPLPGYMDTNVRFFFCLFIYFC